MTPIRSVVVTNPAAVSFCVEGNLRRACGGAPAPPWGA
jgi:hypothetical protein